MSAFPGAVPEAEDTAGDAERTARLQALGAMLARERSDYVSARAASGVERRWLDDQDFYNGVDGASRRSMVETVASGGRGARQPPEELEARSRVFVNITRPKTNAAEARIADMLLPVDERHWGLKPTPVPEMAALANDRETLVSHLGQPVMLPDATAPGGARQATVADVVQPILREAQQRAELMQREIDDQLTEFDYNAVCREVIHYAAVLGTGVLKGPVVASRLRQSWTPISDGQRTMHVLRFVETKRPISEAVNPWDFFPDPQCGGDIRAARAVWERRRLSPRQLRELRYAPGYIAEAIDFVLEQGPQRGEFLDHRFERDRGKAGATGRGDEPFEVWERHGDITARDLADCGCEVDLANPGAIYSGCVVMVNNTIIKAYINPIETGDLPYDVFVWERDDGSVFGYGIPYMMRQASQRMLNAAIRQALDNGGLSAGPQVVMRRGAVEPADGSWTVRGRKVWYLNEDGVKLNDCFGVFEVRSNIAEYLRIVELALKFADEEIALPMIMAGERGTAPTQVGSMQMLMNAATVVLRRLVKRYDDCITKPHIRRYYDWNMAHNPKEEIKGDYEVDARGSTALIQRDAQNLSIIKWMAALGNQSLAWMLDPRKMMKKALQADMIPPDEVMPTDDELDRREELMRNAKPQPSPDAVVRAESAVAVAQIGAQSRLAEAQLKGGDPKAAREHELLMAAIDADVSLRDLMVKRGINLDKLKAELAMKVVQAQVERENTIEEQRWRAAMGAAPGAAPPPSRFGA